MRFRLYFPGFVDANPVPDVEVTTMEEVLALPEVLQRKTSQFKQFSVNEDKPTKNYTLMVELTNDKFWVVGFLSEFKTEEELASVLKMPKWIYKERSSKSAVA